jgi:pimeloyl-ACP methyl ester carboxylesterase
MPESDTRVLCVPGRHETGDEAFRRVRWPPGYQMSGLDWDRDLMAFSMAEQVARVLDRARACWRPNDVLAGRSYGAWILLNALLEASVPYPGTVVCMASALGYGRIGRVGFISPRAGRFWTVANRRPAPARALVLIHAEDDDLCPIDLVRRLGALWGARVIVYPSGGHGLGKSSAVEW